MTVLHRSIGNIGVAIVIMYVRNWIIHFYT